MSILQIQNNLYYKSKFDGKALARPVSPQLRSIRQFDCPKNYLRTKDAFQSATKDCCSKEKAKRVAITTFLSFPLQAEFQMVMHILYCITVRL